MHLGLPQRLYPATGYPANFLTGADPKESYLIEGYPTPDFGIQRDLVSEYVSKRVGISSKLSMVSVISYPILIHRHATAGAADRWKVQQFRREHDQRPSKICLAHGIRLKSIVSHVVLIPDELGEPV